MDFVAGERGPLFDQSPAASFVVDGAGVVRAANAALAELVGRSVAELEGKPAAAFSDPAAPERARRGDGTELVVERTARAITWDGAPAELVVLRDRTRELAVAGAQADEARMAGLARFGGSLVHDVNNMLSVIISYADFLVTDLEGHASHADATEIKEAGRRINELMVRLSAFTKQSAAGAVVVDAHAELEAMLPALREAAGATSSVELAKGAAHSKIEVDKAAFARALQQLVQNAREASPAGGPIVVATADAEVSAEEAATLEGAKPGPHVVVSVKDSGRGIDEAIRARMFEPFSTTKGRAKGIGLGLPLVHGFARSAGGHIRVTSAPGAGATFALYLPRR